MIDSLLRRATAPGIVRTLIRQVLLLSLVLTVLFTGIQAFTDYRSEMRSIRQHLDELEHTHLSGLTEALWSFDRQAITAQLNGILHRPSIRHVEVRNKDGTFAEQGVRAHGNVISREFPLTRVYNERTMTIGTLIVQADTSPVIRDIFSHMVLTFLMQLGIVAVVSAFIFLLFNRLVTRHLALAAEYFRSFDLGTATPLILPKERAGDEIDTLVDSYNLMQEKLARAYRQLSEREQALRDSEQRLHLATVAARLGVWDWDILRNDLTWDERVLQLYGVSQDEFPGSVEAWETCIHPEDRPGAVAALQAALRGEAAFDIEFRVVHPHGGMRYIRADGVVLRDDAGRPVRMIGLNWDATEQKKAARALLAAESKYKNLLESVQLLAVMLDANGNITFCNDYLLDLTGWKREEVLGRNWFDIFIPQEERETVRQVFVANVTKEDMLHFENRIVTKTDRKRLIAWNNSPVKDEEGTIIGAASIGTDLTDHRRVEEQLRQSLKMDSIGRLAGGVAHDFNNILSVIMGYTELAMLKVPEDSPLHEDLRSIAAAADRSRGITRQLLAFSRKEVISPRPTDLNAAIPSINKTLIRLIGEDIHLIFHPGDDLWTILIDQSQIDQVLVNLAVNARDAMPHGGKLVIETSNVHLDDLYCCDLLEARPGDFVQVTVADSGIGMDRETREHIFEPFYTTKEVGKGTGLGLATVYGIVTQNGGFVNVYSEPGHGTVFKLYFPKCSAGTREKPSAPLIIAGSGTVLLVEDEQQVRQLTATMLQHLGYAVLEAPSARVAVDLAVDPHQTIDLLLTDVVMPQMSGKELFDEIRSARPGIRVLFMSGYTAEIIAQRGVLEEDVHFIQKPFDLKTLALKLAEALSLAPASSP